jgi:hypothetical protein
VILLALLRIYITTLLTWDRSVGILEAEVAESAVNITGNGGNNALFNDQHIT